MLQSHKDYKNGKTVFRTLITTSATAASEAIEDLIVLKIYWHVVNVKYGSEITANDKI